MKKRQIKVGAISYAKLLRALMDGTRTLRELAEETGLHYLTVAQYCAAMHREGVIHICMWEKDSYNRDASKVYRLGQATDAKRYRKTATERQRQTRAKRKHAEMMANLAGATHGHTSTTQSAATV
jgi:DNA-binding IclR family transcriptional regulator